MTQDATVDYRNPMLAVENETEPNFYGLSLTAWLKIAIVSALMVATFRFNLLRLWLKTNPFSGEPNWRHAICVPLIGFYYLFVHRDELLETKVYTAWSGLGILLFGILLFGFGIYPGQNDFIKDFGMVVALFGVVAMLCGWRVMKIAWFPIVFLVCAIPWPELVYSYIASPLQRLAAGVAVGVLRLLNVTSLNSGTKIIINAKGNTWRTLNVAEACAGLRSLMTFISVAAAIAFLSARPLWQKIIVTFMAIPIAIFCNVMRVTGQGLLDHYWSQELSEGFAHQFVGIVMLVPGFFMILFVGWLLDVVFVEVVDERELRRKRATIKPATKPMEAIPSKLARLPQATIPKPPIAKPVLAAPQPATRPVTSPAPTPAVPTVPTPKPAVATIPRPVTKLTAPAVTAPSATAKPAVSAPVVRPGAVAGAPSATVAIKRPAAMIPPAVMLKPPTPGASVAKPPSASIPANRVAAPAKPAVVPATAVMAPKMAPQPKPLVSAPISPETPEAK